MYAYHVPDLDAAGGPSAIAEHPIAKRLAQAGPWQLSRHRLGGALVSWRGASVDPAAYGEGIPTHDGMTFYPWKETLSKAYLARELGRPDRRPDCPVKLACGIEIAIALAVNGARRRTFAGGPKVGEPVDEFAILAGEIKERLEGEGVLLTLDASLTRFLFLAVALRYRVTEEALDRWDILSTADDVPIWGASLGADPKAAAAAGA